MNHSKFSQTFGNFFSRDWLRAFAQVSSRQVAADVRRRILARKTLPPRYLGGYASILELIGARVCDPQQLHTNQPGWNVRETRRHPKRCGSQSRAPIVTLSGPCSGPGGPL